MAAGRACTAAEFNGPGGHATAASEALNQTSASSRQGARPGRRAQGLSSRWAALPHAQAAGAQPKDLKHRGCFLRCIIQSWAHRSRPVIGLPMALEALLAMVCFPTPSSSTNPESRRYPMLHRRRLVRRCRVVPGLAQYQCRLGAGRSYLGCARSADAGLPPHEGGRRRGHCPERRRGPPPARRGVRQERAAGRGARAAGQPGPAYRLHRHPVQRLPRGERRPPRADGLGLSRQRRPHHGQAAGQPGGGGLQAGRHRHGAQHGCSRPPGSRPAAPASRTSSGATAATWIATSSPRWPAATGFATRSPC